MLPLFDAPPDRRREIRIAWLCPPPHRRLKWDNEGNILNDCRGRSLARLWVLAPAIYPPPPAGETDALPPLYDPAEGPCSKRHRVRRELEER